jgi:RNA polymerase sigma-70 factor (ECF subfamily)
VSDAPDESDAVLMERANRGESEAFGRLFLRHRDRVFRHVLRAATSTADAEDVVALTFLEAWRRRSSLRTVSASALPWLLVTATHVAQNRARAERRYRAALARLPLNPEFHDHADRVLDEWESARQRRALREALRKLSPSEREVIALCVIEELSMDAAAEALGIPIGTVKSRLSRARARLSAMLRPGEEPPALFGEARA